MKRVALGLAAGVLLVAYGCGGEGRDLKRAFGTFSAEELARHTEVLASDSFEGRGPSSAGEEKTVNYLKAQFEALGLEPGNGESFFQDVPVVAITPDPGITLVARSGGRTTTFMERKDFVAFTKRVVERAEVRNSGVVFVGYGIVAPEYEWNDYAGVDVRGKTVLILVNDPGYATKDTALFTGNAMTYYGRWTYKFEEAARQGAAAAFIVHETGAAAYPWGVVEDSWTGEQFDLVREDNNMSRVAVEGWVTQETATALLAMGGLGYDSLKTLAATRGFKSVALPVTVSVGLTNTLRRSISRNVVALLPGTERPDEYVVYMSHWDHFGRDTTLEGDQIYNGALDNATGTAGLILLAKAFKAVPPKRSILFLSVTAEEQGLLGSGYYATYPTVPATKIAAAINMDALNVLGRTRDVTVIGLGQSELDDYVTAAAEAQGRRITPDPEPEKGFYYRSDHFSFAKVGVPAVYAEAGVDNVQHGEQWARERRDEYTTQRYHKVTDEYDPNWDLSGAIEDLELYFRVGYRLAGETTFPNWRPTSEFRARRDSMMGAR